MSVFLSQEKHCPAESAAGTAARKGALETGEVSSQEAAAATAILASASA